MVYEEIFKEVKQEFAEIVLQIEELLVTARKPAAQNIFGPQDLASVNVHPI